MTTVRKVCCKDRERKAHGSSGTPRRHRLREVAKTTALRQMRQVGGPLRNQN